MAVLRLYAIDINDVRDLFGAQPALAERIRAVTAPHLTPLPEPSGRGFLRRLGPIFSRVPGTPAMDPAALRTTDVDELIQGRYPSPGRLTARWQLVEILLAEFSDRHLSVDVTAHQLNDIDFSLACVDVPSHLGLNQLLRDDPRIGFPPDQGMQVGYTRGRLITERAAAYPAAVDRISEPDRRDIVRRLAEWFAAGPPWSDHASSGLDLIAMFGDRPTTV